MALPCYPALVIPSSKDRHGGVPVSRAKQQPRFRRIEGQVRGLRRMIEAERDCIEVVHQIDVAADLRRVQSAMIRARLGTLTQATIDGDLTGERRQALADEVAVLIAKGRAP